MAEAVAVAVAVAEAVGGRAEIGAGAVGGSTARPGPARRAGPGPVSGCRTAESALLARPDQYEPPLPPSLQSTGPVYTFCRRRPRPLATDARATVVLPPAAAALCPPKGVPILLGAPLQAKVYLPVIRIVHV